jgi:phosphatidylinositol alpha-mannosyltransferase
VRIALVCPYAWDRPGGVQVHVRQLASELRRASHDVVILAPGAGVTGDVRSVGPATGFRYQGTVAPISISPASAARVRAELRGFGPDVVHVHEPFVPFVGLAAALSAPAPVVATFHAYAERSRALTIVAPLLRPVWRRLAVRLAVSEAAAGFVRSRFARFGGPDVRVVPNGCDVDAFAAAEPAEDLPDGRRLLWVGRLDPQKGFPVAVRAFDLLARDRPDLWFVVAGDGADRSRIDRLPGGLRDRVVMLGAVEHERLPRYVAGSAAYVSPALGQESFGLVLVEAMAAGVPVVASDIAGYREVVRRDVDGLLVPPRDPVALASAAGPVLDDAALSDRLRAAGRARAEAFSWRNVMPQIEAAYREALRVAPRGTL